VRVLSLGAGVQSSTLLLMACEGEEQIDAAIFADTGWEPKGVYQWLDVLRTRAEVAGIAFYVVAAGNLRADELRRPYTVMPLRMLSESGESGMLRRQCTERYKIRPINRKLRDLGATRQQPVELAIGISLDEYHRMKPHRSSLARAVWPLIERRMTRADCVAWLAERGVAEPEKSACIGCPYHDNAAWSKIMTDPEAWADAVAFDEASRRRVQKLSGQAFLHRSLVPLGEADLRSEQDRGQMELFEADGCGVLCAADEAA
jgi:hypothetical protein